MDALRLPSFTRLTIFAWLLSPILAQNDTTNSDNTNTTLPNLNLCPIHIGDFNPNAPINSTGSINLHWNALMMDPAHNDWIFTLTYNETRNRNASNIQFDTLHDLQGYISAPEASEAHVCAFMFNGLNATSASRQRNGCDGVLDDACTSILREITFESNCRLPMPQQEWTDAVKKVCGNGIVEGGIAFTGKPQDFSNRTCSISHPPGSTFLENYRTWVAMGKGSNLGLDRNASDFTWYDLYVRQTIPFIISAQFSGGISETQVLCVAPKEIVEGGRIPAERSGASWNWRDSACKTISVAVMISLLAALA